MAQPAEYTRRKDFTDQDGDDTDHNALNQEFDAAALSINEIRTNLALIQKDDGSLKNSIVGKDQLAPNAFDDFQQDLDAAVERATTAVDESTRSAIASGEFAAVAQSASQSAAQSEENAAASAANAAGAAKALFDGIYLGSLSSDPTVDGNGQPLTDGDFYFNNVAKLIRTWDATSGKWVNATPSGQFKRQAFDAVTDFTPGTTTSLTLASDPQTVSNIFVHFDAAFQHPSEYSLSGQTLTFTSPIPVGVQSVAVSYLEAVFVPITNAILSFPTYAAASAAAATLQDGQVVEAPNVDGNLRKYVVAGNALADLGAAETYLSGETLTALPSWDEIPQVLGKGTTADVNAQAKALADRTEMLMNGVGGYSKIREYAGNGTRLKVQDPTGAHWWVRRGDKSDDYGVSVLKDALSRSWEREVFSGRANVLWVEASDDSQRFMRASQASNVVTIPDGAYEVADIVLSGDITWEGNSRDGVHLLVSENNKGAFYKAEGLVSNVIFRNMTIRAKSGVSGAKGIRSESNKNYLAYAVFDNVEFYQDLQICMDFLPIFLDCNNVRSGYKGNAPGAQTHMFMLAKRNAESGNTPNLNRFRNCQFFRSTNPDGVFDLEYGWGYRFEHCDFEQNSTRCIKAASVRGIVLASCWLEGNGSAAAPEYFRLLDSGLPGMHGTSLFIEDSSVFFLSKGVVTRFVNATGSSRWGVERTSFASIPSGTRLGSDTGTDAVGRPSLGFSGNVAYNNSSTFFNGMYENIREADINYATLGANIKTGSVVSSHELLHASELTPSMFSLKHSGSIASAVTAVPSDLTFGGNAITIKATDSHSIAYFSVPSKIVERVKGSILTFAACAFWKELASEGISLRVWESEPSTASEPSMPVISRVDKSANNLLLGVARATFQVPSEATSLYIGFYIGGGAPNKLCQVERLGLFIGESAPTVF